MVRLRSNLKSAQKRQMLRSKFVPTFLSSIWARWVEERQEQVWRSLPMQLWHQKRTETENWRRLVAPANFQVAKSGQLESSLKLWLARVATQVPLGFASNSSCARTNQRNFSFSSAKLGPEKFSRKVKRTFRRPVHLLCKANDEQLQMFAHPLCVVF